MSTKEPKDNQAKNDPMEPAARPVDMSQVKIQRKNWYGSKIIIVSGSYIGRTSTIAAQYLSELAEAAFAGTPKPDFASIHELTDGSGDLAVVPTLTKSVSTLDMTWTNSGRQAKIDFAPYFMIRRFPIPDDTRAHLPLSFQEVPGLGPAMIIQFSKAVFKPVNTKKQNKTGPLDDGHGTPTTD